MANLAEGFEERGDKVRLMALYPTDRTVRETRLTWEYVYPRRPTTPVAALGLVRAIVRLFRRDRPDWVFTALPAANVMAAIGARLAGVRGRVIISHHSPVETHNPLINAVDGRAASLDSVKTVISVSDTVGDSLAGKPAAYRAKRKTIHNALPPRIETLLGELLRGRAGRVRGRKVVATGRLAAQKNYPVLIRAAVHLPDVMFDIIGNGPDEAELRALAASLGVQDRVNFLGFCPREDAMRLLATGDLFVQMSLFEGHSLGLIEAAKLELPLIVSDVPVQREGVTADDGTICGAIIPPQDDRALAAEIDLLLTDDLRYGRAVELSRRLGREATFDAMMSAYDRLAT